MEKNTGTPHSHCMEARVASSPDFNSAKHLCMISLSRRAYAAVHLQYCHLQQTLASESIPTARLWMNMGSPHTRHRRAELRGHEGHLSVLGLQFSFIGDLVWSLQAAKPRSQRLNQFQLMGKSKMPFNRAPLGTRWKTSPSNQTLWKKRMVICDEMQTRATY